jgi:Pretoxin HINT domain
VLWLVTAQATDTNPMISGNAFGKLWAAVWAALYAVGLAAALGPAFAAGAAEAEAGASVAEADAAALARTAPPPTTRPAPAPGRAAPVRCAGGACTCFVADTPVRTAAGDLPIQSVAVGSRIRTLNEEDCDRRQATLVRIDLSFVGSLGGKAVLLRTATWARSMALAVGAVFQLDDPEIGLARARVDSMSPQIVEAGDGCVVTGTVVRASTQIVGVSLDSGEVLHTTPAHPFFVQETDSFVPAGNLRRGDHLRAMDGRQVVVEMISVGQSTANVFNLEVDGAHTYLVGNASVWVHNECTGEIRGAAEARQPVRVTDLHDFEAPSGSARRRGHADRHNISLRDPRVLAARNNPTRLYVGTNNSGNQVAGFWRDGLVVFTDLGDTTAVITAYETELTNILTNHPSMHLVE